MIAPYTPALSQADQDALAEALRAWRRVLQPRLVAKYGFYAVELHNKIWARHYGVIHG